MSILNEVHKYHEDFKKQLMFLGCPEYLREDFIQDSYIKFYKASIGKQINNNKAFMATIVRNEYLQFCNKSKRQVDGQWILDNETAEEELDLEKELEDSSIIDDLIEIVPAFSNESSSIDIQGEYGELNGYEIMILNLHYKEKVTMRKLAKESGITLSSIYNTIKKAKLKIKKQLDEKQRIRRLNRKDY